MGDGALVLVIVAVLWVEDQKSKKIVQGMKIKLQTKGFGLKSHLR